MKQTRGFMCGCDVCRVARGELEEDNTEVREALAKLANSKSTKLKQLGFRLVA